jgi:mannose/fructose/N-acetylgalactosamine-specific phosphotransferase system component IIB
MSAAFHNPQPAMESKLILFQQLHQILGVLNLGLKLASINVGRRVPQPAARNAFSTNSVSTAPPSFSFLNFTPKNDYPKSHPNSI